MDERTDRQMDSQGESKFNFETQMFMIYWAVNDFKLK